MESPRTSLDPAHGQSRLQDRQRLDALEAAGLLGPGLAHTLDRLAELASDVIGAPVALVSLVSADRQTFVGSTGLPEPYGQRGWTGLSHSFCQIVVQNDAPLIVSDSREDERTRENLAIEDLGVIAYAGMPVRDPAGHVLGSMCAIDGTPREWTDRQLELLKLFSDLLTALVADRVGMSSETRAEQDAGAEAAALARRLQRALLPGTLDGTAAERVISAYQPGSRQLLLGGDFADVYAHPDGTHGFVLGDVCGHGPESAATAISLRASWAALEAGQPPLEELIDRLNVIASREHHAGGAMFATVVMGRVSPEPNGSRAIRAGHPEPIDLTTSTEVPLPPGPVIGIFDDATWTSGSLPDRHPVLAYTDGLIEGRISPESNERLGADRLLASLARDAARRTPLEQLPERLIREATKAHGDELPDDVALLILR